MEAVATEQSMIMPWASVVLASCTLFVPCLGLSGCPVLTNSAWELRSTRWSTACDVGSSAASFSTSPEMRCSVAGFGFYSPAASFMASASEPAESPCRECKSACRGASSITQIGSGTHSHLLREMFLLLLAGVPAEQKLGGLVFLAAYLVSGAFGALFSWLTLRRSLRNSPDYAAMPRHHVDAVADLSNSRGASSCVYGAAVLAVLVAGDSSLSQCFMLDSNVANSFLVAARLLPEFISPRSSRLKKHCLPATLILCMLIFGAFRAPVSLTVAQAVSFWFSLHCLLRLCPAILSLSPQSEYAATDYAGHIYGALYAGLCGACHLYLNSIAWPGVHAILALVILTLSTLPQREY